jgi:prolyl-tRNA synthetase
VQAQMARFEDRLRTHAEEEMARKITAVSSMEEIPGAVQAGVAIVNWCGSEDCAERIEKETGAALLGSDIRSDDVKLKEGPCVACGRAGRPALVGRSY